MPAESVIRKFTFLLPNEVALYTLVYDARIFSIFYLNFIKKSRPICIGRSPAPRHSSSTGQGPYLSPTSSWPRQ